MIKQVNDSDQISRLVLRGYKSIAECEIELGRLNVLIGANGAGKSNFIGFFRLINRILDQQLQTTVGLEGRRASGCSRSPSSTPAPSAILGHRNKADALQCAPSGFEQFAKKNRLKAQNEQRSRTNA